MREYDNWDPNHQVIIPASQPAGISPFRSKTRLSPLSEIRVHHSIGESFATNTDTLKHAVAGELMHHEMGIDDSRLFQFVRDDTTNEMRMSGVKSMHQFVELFL